MDRYQMVVVVAYIVAILVAVFGFWSTKKSDTTPVWCLWLACIIAGIAAYFGRWLGLPVSLFSGIILYVIVPVLLIWTALLGFGYAKAAAFGAEEVSIHGWTGSTPRPALATDPWKQGDVAFLLASASLISVFMGVYLGINTFRTFWNSLPEPAGQSAIERTMELAEKLETVRGQKPLKVTTYPFSITLYPQEFPNEDFSDDMATVFDPKIADLGIEVDEFIQLKAEEVNGGIDLVGFFCTKPLDPAGVIPAGNERMTVRIPVETSAGVDAWVEEHIFPRVQILTDSAEATGLLDASSGAPAPTRPRIGVPVPLPSNPGRIGNGA